MQLQAHPDPFNTARIAQSTIEALRATRQPPDLTHTAVGGRDNGFVDAWAYGAEDDRHYLIAYGNADVTHYVATDSADHLERWLLPRMSHG
ncbi:hypothetical protein [Metallibacterium scheffleri]|uniref:Uncharacterized protein n=1 Tax=Metallibacterium scheffleri TaxID=993689 RepID=A0A4S3KQF9_9GAMM|nr:hypothetical protein [Metallibacterium scheffleri]THD11285.1 hypothetical protein B1806_03975 [Metallibacterium scheffleri]